ncbi:MAG: hypothetical protein RBS08_01150 [Bdellovibrionales bacterium]|jgi:hypothetical protein|nr:hypothetical protein [Bdellovibrionales bacterium]
MLAPVKKVKDKLIKSADSLTEQQLDRRLKVFKTLSLYYGTKIVIGGALVAGGIATLALGAFGIALPLPVWAGAGGLGVGAVMTANAIIGNRAFNKTYKTYAQEKAARHPEGLPETATQKLTRSLKTQFDQKRKKAITYLPRKNAAPQSEPANDTAAPAPSQRKNAP